MAGRTDKARMCGPLLEKNWSEIPSIYIVYTRTPLLKWVHIIHRELAVLAPLQEEQFFNQFPMG